MKKQKSNKGITLIALIITIIVLIILAVVAINAVQGDGIIAHAKNARDDYQAAQERENSALAGYLSQIDNALGNNSGKAQDGDSEAPDILKKYILGEDLQGRLLTDIANMEEEISFKDETSTIKDASTTANVIFTDDEDNLGILYFKYNGEFYRFGVNLEDYMTDKTYGLVKISGGIEGTEVGKYVEYDGKLWRILYDDKENGLQMISENVLKYNENEFDLGYVDTSITDWSALLSIADIDGNGTLEDWEKSLYSYNHAISTLNKACEDIVEPSNKITGVRCVGSNPKDKNSENTTLYTSDTTVNWPNNKKKGYSTDKNYLSDFDRMLILGISNASYTGEFGKDGDGNKYWLASRLVDESSGGVYFSIRHHERFSS